MGELTYHNLYGSDAGNTTANASPGPKGQLLEEIPDSPPDSARENLYPAPMESPKPLDVHVDDLPAVHYMSHQQPYNGRASPMMSHQQQQQVLLRSASPMLSQGRLPRAESPALSQHQQQRVASPGAIQQQQRADSPAMLQQLRKSLMLNEQQHQHPAISEAAHQPQHGGESPSSRQQPWQNVPSRHNPVTSPGVDGHHLAAQSPPPMQEQQQHMGTHSQHMQHAQSPVAGAEQAGPVHAPVLHMSRSPAQGGLQL